MKNIKWKTLIITCLVCLLPVLLGLALWQRLPYSIAIHFNMYNQPDNFAHKSFVVFGLPALMAVLQIICCVASDINTAKHGSKKFETAAKWIIPVMAVVVQTATLLYGIGIMVDIRRVAVAVVAAEFLVLGNYLPKLDYVKNYKIEPQKARKINRFMGKTMVIMGLLAIVSLFLPPVYSVIWLILLIPCVIFCIVKAGRKK